MESKVSDYEAAEKYIYTFKRKIKFLLQYLKINFMILLLLIPEAVRGIFNFMCPKKPKCIKDQVALITGAGNGLGRALAFRLARERCKLAIIDIDFYAAQLTAKEIETKFNVTALPFKVDISNHEQVTKLREDVERSVGKVDILVNNAGLLSMDISLREGSPQKVQKVIDVNLSSQFWTLRTFLGGMIERKRGHVVAISSFGGKMTFPCSIAYCATKFGVTGFMDALFDELCLLDQDFIKTTTAYPTFINTQKELGLRLDANGEPPRMEPEQAASFIVKGILMNRRHIYLPKYSKFSLLVNNLPDRIIKYVKTKAIDSSQIKNERLHNAQP